MVKCLKCSKHKKVFGCIDCFAEEQFEERKRTYILALKEILKHAKNDYVVLNKKEIEEWIEEEQKRVTW